LQAWLVAFFDQPTTAAVGPTLATESFLQVEMFGRWLSIPEGMPLLELLVAAYFAARDRH
jgi:hypothetical protein